MSKGGKGKGKHLSKLRKYGVGAINNKKNDERREKKHKTLISQQISLKEERLNLLADVKLKYPNTSHSRLRARFGTLNIHRMKDILNDTFETAKWYINRQALLEARRHKPIAKSQVRYVKFKKKENKRGTPKGTTGKVQEVPNGPDDGVGQTQVD